MIVVLNVAAWKDRDAERHIGWARAFWTAARPFALDGIYVNYLENEGEEHVRATYGANYDRLVALKNQYDPTNLFRLNQNIKPTTK